MSDTVSIRNDSTFRAEISLDSLTQLDLSAWKKLCKMFRLFPFQNDAAIQTLDAWFPDAMALEKGCAEYAAMSYEMNYTDPESVPRKHRRKVREENADYKRLMTDTRRALDRLRRFHSAYVEATSAA